MVTGAYNNTDLDHIFVAAFEKPLFLSENACVSSAIYIAALRLQIFTDMTMLVIGVNAAWDYSLLLPRGSLHSTFWQYGS